MAFICALVSLIIFVIRDGATTPFPYDHNLVLEVLQSMADEKITPFADMSVTHACIVNDAPLTVRLEYFVEEDSEYNVVEASKPWRISTWRFESSVRALQSECHPSPP